MTAETLHASIASARRAVADGAELDLTGFAAAIESLCTEAAALPAAARAAAARDLRLVSTALDDLAADLRDQHSRRAAGAEQAARSRAAQAYGPPSVGDAG
jgi:hypothetical protein